MRRFVILGTFLLPLPFAALPLFSLLFASPGHAGAEVVAVEQPAWTPASVQTAEIADPGCGGGPQVQLQAPAPHDS